MENLNHIYTFYIVAKLGGVSKATGALHVTQSAVSHSLKALEDELGARLIERSKKRFYLTESGKILLEACERMFGAYESCKEGIKFLEGEIAGEITIGCHVNLGSLWLPSRLAALQKLYPSLIAHAALNVQNDLLLDDVVTFKTDIAIITEGFIVPNADIAVQKACDAAVVLVASPAYLKSASAIRDVSDIMKHTYIDWNNTLPTLRHLLKFNPEESAKFEKYIFINNPVAIRNAVIEGMGITALPYYSVKEDIDAGRLARILPKKIKRSVGVFCCYMKQRRDSMKLKAVKDYIMSELTKLPS